MTRPARDLVTIDLFEWDAMRQAAATEQNARRHAAFQKERLLEAQREHEQRHDRQERRQETKAERRLREITFLIRHRHGTACDTDDGEAYLRAALPSLIEQAHETGRDSTSGALEGWRARWVPRVPVSHAAFLAGEVERLKLSGSRIHQSAGEAGDLLCLTIEERTAAGITGIRPAGWTDKDMNEHRRTQERERKRRAREAAGAKPQATSDRRTKPWLAEGISESTWRRRRAADSVSSALEAEAPDRISSAADYNTLVRTECGQPPADRRHGPALGVWWAHKPKGYASAPVRAQSVRQGRAAPIEITNEGEQHGLGDLAQPAVDVLTILEELEAFNGGRFTESIAAHVLDIMRQRGTTKSALARVIGVQPAQMIRALNGSRGLSQSATANLKRWLAA